MCVLKKEGVDASLHCGLWMYCPIVSDYDLVVGVFNLISNTVQKA